MLYGFCVVRLSVVLEAMARLKGSEKPGKKDSSQAGSEKVRCFSRSPGVLQLPFRHPPLISSPFFLQLVC